MKKILVQSKKEISSASRSVFREVAASFLYAGKNLKTLAFISCDPQSDVHEFTWNLAKATAQDGKRILLIRAAIGEGDGEEKGLTCYLAGHCAAEDIVYDTDIPEMRVIPTGSATANPGLLLKDTGLQALIGRYVPECDWVFLDTAPVTEQDDSAVRVAACCDAAVLVVKDRISRTGAMRRVREAVEQTGRPVIGCVVLEARKAADYTGQ